MCRVMFLDLSFSIFAELLAVAGRWICRGRFGMMLAPWFMRSDSRWKSASQRGSGIATLPFLVGMLGIVLLSAFLTSDAVGQPWLIMRIAALSNHPRVSPVPPCSIVSASLTG